MISIKFPALHNALAKNLKDLEEDDPRRGIIVLNNNAIVLRDSFCLVCNLYDFFTIEGGIEDDLELQELERVLFYMDGKVFSKDFWNELTKFLDMKINNGSLHIENPKYSKDLHGKELQVDMIEPLSLLTNIQKQAIMELSAVAIPFSALNDIYSVLKSDFKTDIIIFEFTGQDMPVKFTFRKRKHFYGFINPHYDAAQEGFKFEDLETFTQSFSEMLASLKEEAKSKTPPPPPIEQKETVEEQPENQLKLVED